MLSIVSEKPNSANSVNNVKTKNIHTLSSNHPITKVSKLMSNGDFREIFDKYFSDWDDIKVIIMIMKTYDFIDKEYSKITKKTLTSDEISLLIQQMLVNGDYRQFLVNEMSDFMNNGHDFMKNILVKQLNVS